MLASTQCGHCEHFAIFEKSLGPSWAKIQKSDRGETLKKGVAQMDLIASSTKMQ